MSNLSRLLIVLLVAKPACPMIVGEGDGGPNQQGLPAALTLACTPDPLECGAPAPGSSSLTTVSCANSGIAQVTVTAVATDSPEFAATSDALPASVPPSASAALLAPGQSLTINVRLTPVSAGSKSALLKISGLQCAGSPVTQAGAQGCEFIQAEVDVPLSGQ